MMRAHQPSTAEPARDEDHDRPAPSVESVAQAAPIPPYASTDGPAGGRVRPVGHADATDPIATADPIAIADSIATIPVTTDPANPSADPAAHANPASEPQWQALPQRVRRVWMVNEVIGCAIALAICAIAATVCLINGWWDFWQPLAIGLIAAWAVLDLASQPLQTKYSYAFHRFAIGEHDLRIKKGWLFRSSTTIPFNRVQHVDTKQNPVLRHFDLTAVVVHTAVSEHEIEALDTAQAERVVQLITERVATAKEDL